MQIDKIVTLANRRVRLQFLAMERSLRAAGCDLPIEVFPYDANTFDLPAGSTWVHTPLHKWMTSEGAHPMCCKYHCLTEPNVLCTDVDIVYLRDPRRVLVPYSGFVVADTEWNKPRFTFNKDTAPILAKRTSLWLKNVFSGGFFASEKTVYPLSMLEEILRQPARKNTYLHTDDQIGLNLLIAQAGITPTNLNLPPSPMESTWAGDYPGEYEGYWTTEERRPMFIHWAGPVLEEDRPINELFYHFLTADEKREWLETEARRVESRRRAGKWPLGVRLLNQLVRRLYPAYYVQPLPPR